MADTMIDAGLLAHLPEALGRHVVSLRRKPDGSAVLVLAGEGLTGAARALLEEEASAALAAAGVVSRVAVMAARDEAVRQRPATPAAPQATGPKIIAVASGKGGVGKSTIAANLAVGLHRLGRRVGLVDADIYGPSAPRLMDNDGQRPRAEGKQLVPIASRHGPAVLSMGHLVEAGKAVAWRGPMAAGALGQLIGGDWGDTEVLVVDLPPGTGDIQLTMVQRHKPVGAVIVSTPQDLALIDAARAMQLFATAGVPIIGLIENMAGYLCPHCGEVSEPFGLGGAEAMAAELGAPFLGRVPLTMAIREASDAGEPPAAGDSVEGRGLLEIAAKVAGWLDGLDG